MPASPLPASSSSLSSPYPEHFDSQVSNQPSSSARPFGQQQQQQQQLPSPAPAIPVPSSIPTFQQQQQPRQPRPSASYTQRPAVPPPHLINTTPFPALQRDWDAVLCSNYETPFEDAKDVVARLLPWHVWQVPQRVIQGAKGKGKARQIDGLIESQGKSDDEVVWESVVDDSTTPSTQLKRRKISEDNWHISIPCVEKAGDETSVQFERIQGMDYPTMDDLENVIPRYQSLRDKIKRLRHRGLGGEVGQSQPQVLKQEEAVGEATEPADLPPAATPFAIESHLQLLRLAYWQDRTDVEAMLGDLRTSKIELVGQHGQIWQREADSLAPGVELPPYFAMQHRRAETPAIGSKATSPGPYASGGPSRTSPVSDRLTANNSTRTSGSPGATPGATTKKVGKPRGPYNKTKARSPSHQGPSAPSTPGGSTPFRAGPSGSSSNAQQPPPQLPIRVILPLNLIARLTNAGIAPLPAPHLQPAIEAHKRRAQANAANPNAPAQDASWTTAPCDPSPNQTEPAVLLGITEATAPTRGEGGRQEWHQLVHLSVILNKLNPQQLTALAEAVNLVQGQGQASSSKVTGPGGSGAATSISQLPIAGQRVSAAAAAVTGGALSGAIRPPSTPSTAPSTPPVRPASTLNGNHSVPSSSQDSAADGEGSSSAAAATAPAPRKRNGPGRPPKPK